MLSNSFLLRLLGYFLHSTPHPPPNSRRLPSSLVIESARQSTFGFSLNRSRLALPMNANDFWLVICGRAGNSVVYPLGGHSAYFLYFPRQTYDKPGSADRPTPLETCCRTVECGDRDTQPPLLKQQRNDRGNDSPQPGAVTHHHRTTEWQATYGTAFIFAGRTQFRARGFQQRRGKASNWWLNLQATAGYR
jgi:hypothetical protein